MSATFLFVQTVVLLLIEGSALALILLPSGSWLSPLAFSLPLAAFANVLLVFVYTVTGIPLIEFTILGGHLLITVIVMGTIYRKPTLLMNQTRTQHPKPTGFALLVTSVAGLLITMNVIYSFSHAVLLPSNQYDSATNWTMRSEISFVDQHIAFDPDESRGMAKPQYPFLFHALQITGNQSLGTWHDTAANTILFLLSLCTFCSLYILIKRLRGVPHSIVTIAALIGVPLLGLHLAQGYGDINLLQYFLLSLACLALWIEDADERKNRWLVLSGIFIAASVWTKSEGLLFGLLPWIVTVGFLCGRNRKRLRSAASSVFLSIGLSLPWPLFAWAKSLSLTPHSSDTLFSFHAEGVSEAILGLLSRGSFGIDTYALLLLIPVLIFYARKKDPHTEARQIPLLILGGIMCAGFLFVYLCTPNVRFLLNGESYYRQMMIPIAMVILACSFVLNFRKR